MPISLLGLSERTRVITGAGSLAHLAETASELGGRRVLLISDPGVEDAGHTGRAREVLEAGGAEVSVFTDLRVNPTTEDVEACLGAARAFRPDLLVAVGGGSAIDTAKGANFLLAGGGKMEDYWGKGKARGQLLPMIAVPTTAGTGSEVQSFALVARVEDHQKMACGDPQAAPRVAILDPLLTGSMPRSVAACTGLDCLTHAVEAAVTLAGNATSLRFARGAFGLAAGALPAALGPEPPERAREDMLCAAALAGLAIEHSMLGAAHSLANPLTAHFGMDHGRAVATMLPHVVRYNSEHPEARAEYEHLARSADIEGGAEGLAQHLASLLDLAQLPRGLTAAGVAGEDLQRLAREAAAQWTAQFNPRPVDEASLAGLLEGALVAR